MEENINTEELKRQLIHRDRVVRIISKDGFFRGVAIKNSQTTKTAQDRHELNYLEAYFLSRAMSAASMLASFLKGEERVKLELVGDGPINMVYAEALSLGETRGYVGLNSAKQTVIQDISNAIGTGTLRITRVVYNRNEPLVSILPLQKGDVATDVAYYYTQSEQVPTAVLLDTTFDDDGKIKNSGGLMIQAMPGHSIEDLVKVFAGVNDAKSFADRFEGDITPKDLLKEILPFEFDVVKSTQVDFFCRCSKDTFTAKLKTLGIEEIKQMYSEGHNELICHYCNEKYILDESDFTELIEEITAKNN